jgi:hypothetical protein
VVQRSTCAEAVAPHAVAAAASNAAAALMVILFMRMFSSHPVVAEPARIAIDLFNPWEWATFPVPGDPSSIGRA